MHKVSKETTHTGAQTVRLTPGKENLEKVAIEGRLIRFHSHAICNEEIRADFNRSSHFLYTNPSSGPFLKTSILLHVGLHGSSFHMVVVLLASKRVC